VNDDFLDLLRCLLDAEARFLVVGAHALAAHGVPRATGDLDIWIERSANNRDRVWAALIAFGAPTDALGIQHDDLDRPDMVIQIGIPPRRIDLLTDITGVEVHNAWPDRLNVAMQGLVVPFLDRASLITNKRATGRTRDRADLEALGEPAD
jgi:hypothetical protein